MRLVNEDSDLMKLQDTAPVPEDGVGRVFEVGISGTESWNGGLKKCVLRKLGQRN